MSPKKLHERDFLKRFSLALSRLPEDDAEVVLFADAYRMYLLGLVQYPDETFRDMQRTYRRAREIKEHVVSVREVDLEKLVEYFQNDLAALRMALPPALGGRKREEAKAVVDLLADRAPTGAALRRRLNELRDALVAMEAGDLSPGEATDRVAGLDLADDREVSLAMLEQDRKPWETQISGAERSSPMDDRSPWYPAHIFAWRLIECLKGARRTSQIVARCKGCDAVFVRMSGRDALCGSTCDQARRRPSG